MRSSSFPSGGPGSPPEGREGRETPAHYGSQAMVPLPKPGGQSCRHLDQSRVPPGYRADCASTEITRSPGSGQRSPRKLSCLKPPPEDVVGPGEPTGPPTAHLRRSRPTSLRPGWGPHAAPALRGLWGPRPAAHGALPARNGGWDSTHSDPSRLDPRSPGA